MDKYLSQLKEASKTVSKKNFLNKVLIVYLFIILLLLPVFYQLNKAEAQIDIRLIEVNEKLQKNPYNPDLLVDLAWIYFETGRLQKALDAIEKSLKVDKNHIGANYVVGLIYTDLNRFQEAEEAFEVVIENSQKLGEGSILALYGLGLLYKEKKDYISAVKILNEAISQKPYMADLHLELGVLYWEIGNKPLAEKSFNKAISINGDVLPIINKVKSKR